MQKIHSDKAPAAIGPYSQAYRAGDFVFTSGQIGIVPETGRPAGDDVAAQAEQAIANLREVLAAAGTDFTRVVKTTCFLADMADFKTFNAVYEQHFVSKPARSCFAVKELPMGLRCEIEVVAYLGE